jgi:single-stranded DNA-binding protein
VIQFLDSKTSDGDSGGSRGGQARSANQQNPGTQGAAGESGRDDQGGNSVQESRPDDDFIKDDIPF